MPELVSLDPVTQVYDKLAATIRTRLVTQQIIKLGNWIDYSGDELNPHKPSLEVADLPQVTLAQSAFGFDAFGPSSSSISTTMEAIFPLVVLAEDLRLDHLNRLVWQTYCGVYALGPRLGITDASASAVGQFVDSWRIQNARQDLYAADRVPRWRAVCEVVVSMRWPRGAIT